MRGQAAGKPSPQMLFFKSEYLVDLALANSEKPVVSLIDGACLLTDFTFRALISDLGITMGGGVGVSIHGAFRVATERTVISMPETGGRRVPLRRSCRLCRCSSSTCCSYRILSRCRRFSSALASPQKVRILAPDPSHFSSSIPETFHCLCFKCNSSFDANSIGRSYGTYLALTGRRVSGEEAIALGLATHFVHSSRIPVSHMHFLTPSAHIRFRRRCTTGSASCSSHQLQRSILY